MAPSHYLNQCWNVVNWTLGNKLQWNFNRNSNIFIQENAFENVVCEMASICLGLNELMGTVLEFHPCQCHYLCHPSFLVAGISNTKIVSIFWLDVFHILTGCVMIITLRTRKIPFHHKTQSSLSNNAGFISLKHMHLFCSGRFIIG